ncbi:MAG: hypothetical protein LKI98_03125 [Bifidobacterium crudilactis]|nr:hypothetical protein [Bifidobacterium crudilactis]MCI1889412.1 hypothetical protein [Bifidobacterium crudilactis]
MTTTTIARTPGIRYCVGQVNRINRVRHARHAWRMRRMLAALLVMTFTAAATVSFTEMVMLRSASAATQEEAIKAGVKLGVKDGIYLGSLKHQSGVNVETGTKLGVESVATPILWDALFNNSSTNGLTLWSHYLIDSDRPSNRLYSGSSLRTKLQAMSSAGSGAFMAEERSLLYNGYSNIASTCLGVVASGTSSCGTNNTATGDLLYLPAVDAQREGSARYSMKVYLGTNASSDPRQLTYYAFPGTASFRTTYKNGSELTCSHGDSCLEQNGSNHWWFRNPGNFYYSNAYGTYYHVMMFMAHDQASLSGQISKTYFDSGLPNQIYTYFGLRPVTSMKTSGIIWASEINGSMGGTPNDVGATNWSYEPNAIGGRNYRLTLVKSGSSDASLNTPTCPIVTCSVYAGTAVSVGSGTTVEPGNQLAYKIVKNVGQADEQVVAYGEGAPGQSTVTGDVVPTGSNTFVMWEQQYKSSGTRLASIPVIRDVQTLPPSGGGGGGSL